MRPLGKKGRFRLTERIFPEGFNRRLRELKETLKPPSNIMFADKVDMVSFQARSLSLKTLFKPELGALLNVKEA